MFCLTHASLFVAYLLQKSVRNKTLQKQIYKTDFKSPDKTEVKTPGWEADVSPPFLKVHFPKNLRSASKFLKRVTLSAICFAEKNANALTLNFLTK